MKREAEPVSDDQAAFPAPSESTVKTFPSVALQNSGSAAAYSAVFVAAGCVFAPIAVSVAGASVRLAAFALHWHSVSPASGVPGPASAGVCLVPVAASRFVDPAAAGISCPASGCPYLERWAVPRAEGREDGRPCWVEQHCSLDAPDFHHDWVEYKALLPLWPAQRHGH